MRRGVPFWGVFLGVLFAEPLLLFFPFFFPMLTVQCRRAGKWRVCVQSEGDCKAAAANAQVPATSNDDDDFPSGGGD